MLLFLFELDIFLVDVERIHQNRKMAACSDCSICRDSFDAVLVIIYANMLETYDNFLEETVSVMQKVKQSEFLTYQ